MHRTRIGLTEAQIRKWAPEFQGQPDIGFVVLPRTMVQIHGDFEGQLAGWAPAAADATEVVVPIHPGQWPHIRARAPSARLLPDVRPALAQASVRASPTRHSEPP